MALGLAAPKSNSVNCKRFGSERALDSSKPSSSLTIYAAVSSREASPGASLDAGRAALEPH